MRITSRALRSGSEYFYQSPNTITIIMGHSVLKNATRVQLVNRDDSEQGSAVQTSPSEDTIVKRNYARRDQPRGKKRPKAKYKPSQEQRRADHRVRVNYANERAYQGDDISSQFKASGASADPTSLLGKSIFDALLGSSILSDQLRSSVLTEIDFTTNREASRADAAFQQKDTSQLTLSSKVSSWLDTQSDSFKAWFTFGGLPVLLSRIIDCSYIKSVLGAKRRAMFRGSDGSQIFGSLKSYKFESCSTSISYELSSLLSDTAILQTVHYCGAIDPALTIGMVSNMFPVGSLGTRGSSEASIANTLHRAEQHASELFAILTSDSAEVAEFLRAYAPSFSVGIESTFEQLIASLGNYSVCSMSPAIALRDRVITDLELSLIELAEWARPVAVAAPDEMINNKGVLTVLDEGTGLSIPLSELRKRVLRNFVEHTADYTWHVSAEDQYTIAPLLLDWVVRTFSGRQVLLPIVALCYSVPGPALLSALISGPINFSALFIQFLLPNGASKAYGDDVEPNRLQAQFSAVPFWTLWPLFGYAAAFGCGADDISAVERRITCRRIALQSDRGKFRTPTLLTRNAAATWPDLMKSVILEGGFHAGTAYPIPWLDEVKGLEAGLPISSCVAIADWNAALQRSLDSPLTEMALCLRRIRLMLSTADGGADAWVDLRGVFSLLERATQVSIDDSIPVLLVNLMFTETSERFDLRFESISDPDLSDLAKRCSLVQRQFKYSSSLSLRSGRAQVASLARWRGSFPGTPGSSGNDVVVSTPLQNYDESILSHWSEMFHEFSSE